MADEVTAPVYDMTFDEYHQRQMGELDPSRISARAAECRPANHFLFSNDTWSPQSYVGAAVVSMLDENPDNAQLTTWLTELQGALCEGLELPQALYLLPASSFHQTVANTLSGPRYEKFVVDAYLKDDYPRLVQEALNAIKKPRLQKPIKMKMIGLSLFSNAVGMLGSFEAEEDYEAIVQFRSSFYADSTLQNLDVRMTRAFIGHVTLAYVESDLDQASRTKLAQVVNSLNESIKDSVHYFNIERVELRQYEHLAKFDKPEVEASYSFITGK